MVQPLMPFDALALQPRMGLQPPFVKYLGCEFAYLWMQPPSFFQEQALVGWNRLRPCEQMFECRRFGSFRMASPQRLFQLLRVTKQNDASGGLGSGQYVRERHLSPFINKKDINAFEEISSRPEPGCTPEDVTRAILYCGQGLGVTGRKANARRWIQFRFTAQFLHAGGTLVSGFPRDGQNPIQKISDDFVTDRCHADLFSMPDQFTYHFGARTCLAGSRRSLNG